MTDPQGMRCSACGVPAVAAFVQYGSYFTMCMACRDAGPATSWLALKTQLQGSFRAVAVGSDFELKDEIASARSFKLRKQSLRPLIKAQLVRLTMAADLNIAEIPYDTGAIRYRYGRVLSADGSRWIRHGPFVEYHLNGRIACEGTYVNGAAGNETGKNLGVGTVAGIVASGLLAALSISVPTSASLTHRRTRFGLMPLAIATAADDTPGLQQAATMCALNSEL